MSYAVARRDLEYLETIAELEDWVEVDGECRELMRSPTKQKAEGMYLSAIGLWLFEHRTTQDKRALRIRAKYGF